MASDRMAFSEIEVVVRVRMGAAPGEIAATVRVANEVLEVSVAEARLLLRIWREAPDVIRGSIVHAESGAVAMFQGNDALQRLATAIRLRVDGPG